MEMPEIPAYLLSDEKKRLMDELIYDCLRKIVRYQHDLSLDGIFDIVREYYGEEPYYDEVVAELRKFLQKAGDAGNNADKGRKDVVNLT